MLHDKLMTRWCLCINREVFHQEPARQVKDDCERWSCRRPRLRYQ